MHMHNCRRRHKAVGLKNKARSLESLPLQMEDFQEALRVGHLNLTWLPSNTPHLATLKNTPQGGNAYGVRNIRSKNYHWCPTFQKFQKCKFQSHITEMCSQCTKAYLRHTFRPKLVICNAPAPSFSTWKENGGIKFEGDRKAPESLGGKDSRLIPTTVEYKNFQKLRLETTNGWPTNQSI